jgi:mannose-6-phosphate isomerase
LLIYEIQQASDTTYRLYDYDRGRCMSVSEAIQNTIIPFKSQPIKKDGKNNVLSTPYFQIEHIKNEGIKHYEFEKAK